MARDPEAGRLAARLLLLYGYDRQAAVLLARAAELHIELCRQLQVAERQAVAASQQAERVSGSRPDETAAMLALVGRLRRVATATRALLKARRQALRRLVAGYEEPLGYRKGRTTLLASGREVAAVEWTDDTSPTGRRVERPPPQEDR